MLARILERTFIAFLCAAGISAATLATAERAHADEPHAAAAHVESPDPAAPALPPVAPPGYHFEQKRYLAPIVGGSVGLGLGWAASVATGLLGTVANMTGPATAGGEPATSWGLMFVPIAGPFAVLGTQHPSQRSDGMTAALAILGGVQAAGAVTLFTGLALGSRTVLVPDRSEGAVVVQPVAGPGLAGVQVGGVF